MTCSLYRFYDADDRLLYIGISTQACARLAQHAKDKEWFPSVARASFEHYDTQAEALAAEKAAIKAERPAHNIRHSPTPRVTRRNGDMTVEEVAAYLRVDIDMVNRWANFGRIPHVRRNGSLVFRRELIEKWLLSLRSTEVAS